MKNYQVKNEDSTVTGRYKVQAGNIDKSEYSKPSKKLNSIMAAKDSEVKKYESEKLSQFPVSTRVDNTQFVLQEQTETEIAAILERQGKIPPKKERIRASLLTRYTKTGFNITTKFQGSASDLDLILKDTKLKGLGKNFLAAQEKYGVNALFMIAIAQKESTWGKFTPKKNPYNFAGLGIKNIKSFADCINKLAATLSGDLYVKANPPKATPTKIAPRYCPPKAAQWATDVTQYMNNYRERLLKEVYTA